MEFKNIEVFKRFLDEKLKKPYGCYDFNACIADFEKQVAETGSYELRPYETVSGLPESLPFDKVDRFFLIGENGESVEVDPAEDDFDYAEITIIF